MSAAQVPDPARLEELHSRFEKAAYEFPNVDAVVVHRPDLRREEAEREARNLHFKSADPASEHFPRELTEQTRGAYATMRSALDWEEWIPPSGGSIEQLGGQMYWARVIRADESPEFCGPPACGELWRCTLFGPPTRDVANIALRLFTMLAADAARIILPHSKAEGKALLSRWLIYLADRPEPIVPDARRRYLAWPTRGGNLLSPMWVPVTPLNRPTCWWAVRLANVFWVSALAIGQMVKASNAKEVRRLVEPAKPMTTMMSSAELAGALGVPAARNAVDVALRRFAQKRPWCRENVSNPQKGESRVLYRVEAVWPFLLDKLARWRNSSPTAD